MQDAQTLDQRQVEEATATLTRAFHADPLFEWVFPDEEARANGLRPLFRIFLRYARKRGHVDVAAQARAAAIWMPPGRTVTMGGMLVSGMMALPFQVGFGTFAKLAGAMDVMEKIHKRYAPEPHWYLAGLGVAPEFQGQGLGSALVRPVLERADRERAPCYLETSAERNLPFYERLGFEVVEATHVGKGGPPAWGMKRPVQ